MSFISDRKVKATFAMMWAVSSAHTWAEETGAESALEEIVVTVQRREEKLQDVPIAVSAFDAAQLAATGVADTLALKNVTPGLAFNTALGGIGQPRIRGVGTVANGPGIENPVATYVDGVYISAASATLLSLNDVSQVAVLKGPQGTLFGRNATGGLIQVTSSVPSYTFKANAHGTYANYNTTIADGYITGGLTDSLAASAAVVYDRQGNGYGKNVATGKDVDDHENYAGRVKLRMALNDDSEAILSIDYAKNDIAGAGIHTVSKTIAGISQPGGERDIWQDADPYLKSTQTGASLKYTYDFSNFQFMNLLAVRRSAFNTFQDSDGTAQSLQTFGISLKQRQLSNEFQFLSTGSDAFKWVVGGIYFYDDGRNDPQFGFDRTAIPVPGSILNFLTHTRQSLNSYSAFGQGTYTWNDDTNLTLGLRYTTDSRTISEDTLLTSNIPLPFLGLSAGTESERFNKLTWRLSLDHRFSPELLGYASFNRGFKSGAFVPGTLHRCAPAEFCVTKPEILDALEVGIKSDLLDRTLRLNVATFYYDYTNIQITQIQRGQIFLYNGTGAKSYGIDADINYRATDELTLNAGLAFIHARLSSFPNGLISTPAALGGNTFASGDVTGNRLQNTPDWTANLGAQYDLPTSAGDFTFSGNFYYSDGFFSDVDNRVRQGAYSTIDASALWKAPGDRYDVRVWGKNLTDKLYANQIVATDTGDNRLAAAPRTFGVTFGVHFE